MIPDSPAKAIRFVAAFLPGFLGLGLACYLVDLRFGEFWYAFISIAITTIAFGTVTIVSRIWSRRQKKAPKDVQLVPVYAVAILFGFVVALSYENDWIISGINKLPFVRISKTNQDRPTLYVLKRSLTCRGVRPFDAREEATQMFTRPMLRVKTKDHGTVEGFVRVIPTTLDPNQVFLSPACRIEGTVTNAIPGPGVLVKVDDAPILELIDATASKCWDIHYPDAPACLCPAPEISESYLKQANLGRPEGKKYPVCRADQ
jgi:hypothetical protein